MQVGIALLIEFISPVAVLGWMWLRHGQRPSRLTVAGARVAIAGLALVLDLVSGADLDGLGVALGPRARCSGAAVYWIISADEDNGLPGHRARRRRAAVGGVVLLVAGLVGIVPIAAPRAGRGPRRHRPSRGGWRCSRSASITAAAALRPRHRARPGGWARAWPRSSGSPRPCAGVVLGLAAAGRGAARHPAAPAARCVLLGVVGVRLGEPQIRQEAPHRARTVVSTRYDQSARHRQRRRRHRRRRGRRGRARGACGTTSTVEVVHTSTPDELSTALADHPDLRRRRGARRRRQPARRRRRPARGRPARASPSGWCRWAPATTSPRPWACRTSPPRPPRSSPTGTRRDDRPGRSTATDARRHQRRAHRHRRRGRRRRPAVEEGPRPGRLRHRRGAHRR